MRLYHLDLSDTKKLEREIIVIVIEKDQSI